jgi:hypothetical protein
LRAEAWTFFTETYGYNIFRFLINKILIFTIFCRQIPGSGSGSESGMKELQNIDKRNTVNRRERNLRGGEY